jgi:hypothetical protein
MHTLHTILLNLTQPVLNKPMFQRYPLSPPPPSPLSTPPLTRCTLVIQVFGLSFLTQPVLIKSITSIRSIFFFYSVEFYSKSDPKDTGLQGI